MGTFFRNFNRARKIKGFKLTSNEITRPLFNWLVCFKSKHIQKFPDHYQEYPDLIILDTELSLERELLRGRIRKVQSILKSKKSQCSFDFSSLSSLSQKEALVFYEKFVQENVLDRAIKGGETHHLVPKHMEGYLFESSQVTGPEALAFIDVPTNKYYLTKNHHNIAHCILFIAGNCYSDYSCIYFRSHLHDNEEESRDWAVLKQKQIATLGGSKNSLAQQKARSNSGKLFTATVGKRHNSTEEAKAHCKSIGLQNQNEETKKMLRSKIIWSHNGQKYTTLEHLSTADLRQTLHSFVPRETPGDHSNFAKLLKGRKKIWCGWTILEVLEI